MKKGVLLLVIIVFMVSCNKNNDNNKGNAYVIERYEYSNALNGLIIRQKPDRKSKTLGVIPFGKKVSILKASRDSKTLIVDNEEINGYWHKVEYNNIKGYAFSYYLGPNRENIGEKRVQKFIHNPFISLNGILSRKDMEKYLLNKLGKPLKITRTYQINRINKIKDTIKKYHYKTFNIEIYFAKEVKKQLLWTISIYERFNGRLKYNTKLNISPEEIKKIFGTRVIDDDNKLIYRNTYFDSGVITFNFSSNKLKSIYIDNTIY